MSSAYNVAFVLAATDHGPLIVNRHDYRMTGPGQGYGVGYQLLNAGSFDPDEVSLAIRLLQLRRQHHGDGVIAFDVGANVGAHCVSWARAMRGWGSVFAVEAQERLYYALAGNLALANLDNARAVFAAVGGQCGVLEVPVPDYHRPASFGSLELKRRPNGEYIGQTIDYARLVPVPLTTIDSLAGGLPRVDLIKLDVEGMEAEALGAARETIAQHRPALMVELIKSDDVALVASIQALGYETFPTGLGTVALHRDDPVLQEWRG